MSKRLDEDTEIVTFDVISWYSSILHKFGLEAIDYFLTKYQEDLHPRFKKEFVLELGNFFLKTTRYVPFTSNHPRHCLTNIPFSPARRICTIVENF